MEHINIFFSETTRPTAYTWYVASRSRLLCSNCGPGAKNGAAQVVTCFMFKYNTLKLFVSDNKRHTVLIFPNGTLLSCGSVVKMAPFWRSQRSCGVYCSLTLLLGAVGWSTVCDCGIS